MNRNQLLERLEPLVERYDIENVQLREGRSDLAQLTVPAEKLRDLLIELKDRRGFTHLVFLTAVDYFEEGFFQLTYMLHSYELASDIEVRAYISRENPQADSIHELWAAAATYQRELREMYGIEFPGSPRLYEPFALEGWDDIPPMRREFDTKKYSEETYFPRPGREAYDPAEYMRTQLYPEEEQG